MAVELLPKYETGEGAEDGDRPSDEYQYYLLGSEDPDEMLAALLDGTPSDHPRGLRRTGQRLTAKLGENAWIGTVSYASPDAASGAETGEESFSFDTTGGTQHITQSKGTVAKYPASGPNAAPDLNGAINVTSEDVLGTDITVPAFAFTATRYVSRADMSSGYISDLFYLTGRVNDSPYSVRVDGVPFNFLAGELLFLGARGGKRLKGDWEISLSFAAQPNLFAFTVGTYTISSKWGWEHLWVRYRADGVGSGGGAALLQQPVAVYVEKVYDLDDFSLLGLRS